jgi:hypothetical protein
MVGQLIAIGAAVTRDPCHTTVRTGPYTTVRVGCAAARFQRANPPCMKRGARERPILDYAQDIKSAGLIMNGSKDGWTEP